MASDVVIEIDALTKSFKKRNAVDAVSLNVSQGSVYGFLGPNGAGKTTTIRMLLGLIFPDAGRVSLLGLSVPKQLSKVLPKVGAMIEGPGFVPYLSGAQNIKRLLSATGVTGSKADKLAGEALERVGLSKVSEMSAKKYSLGMKQRLSLAWAVALPRELYVLDEPTNGLDPAGMKEVREIVLDLSRSGSTIFLSSHLLSEVDQICTDVALMSQGRILKNGSMEVLKKEQTGSLEVHAEPVDKAARLLLEWYPDLKTVTDESSRTIKIELPDSDGFAGQLNHRLVTEGVTVSSLRVIGRSLEDVFVRYLGEGFDVR